MLAGVLTLHDPSCSDRCRPAYCISDLEALCRSVLNDHLCAGVKKGGRISGPTSPLTLSQYDDALVYLIETGWELAQRFNGRGRLAGYVQSFLFMRIVDWRRHTFGSSRYGPAPQFVVYDPAVHASGAHWDAEYDDDALDLDAAPAGTREALALIRPLIDGEVQTTGQAAERANVPAGRVTRAVAQVRAAARQQGLAPADEERRELADRARDLREQGRTYPEIATELGLDSHHTARGLLVDFYPETVKRRTRSNGNGTGAATASLALPAASPQRGAQRAGS